MLGVNPKTMPNYKTLTDLKGKKVGVSAPGSSTNVMLNFALAKVGLKPTDVSVIGVGTGNGAVAAMPASFTGVFSEATNLFLYCLLRTGSYVDQIKGRF